MKIKDIIDRYVELSRRIAEYDKAICKLTSTDKRNEKTMRETNNEALKLLDVEFQKYKDEMEQFKNTKISYNKNNKKA